MLYRIGRNCIVHSGRSRFFEADVSGILGLASLGQRRKKILPPNLSEYILELLEAKPVRL